MPENIAHISIPVNTMSVLQDQSVNLLDRVQLAEECKGLYGWSHGEILEITGIPPMTYNRNRKALEKRRKYRYIELYNMDDIEILYQTQLFLLYRKNGNLYLAAVNRGGKTNEKTYLLSPFKPVEKAVVSVLGLVDVAGYRMTSDLRIINSDGQKQGVLMHRIANMMYSIRLEYLVDKKIRFRKKQFADGTFDYRITNIWFPEVDYLSGFAPVTIFRDGDDIVIFREDRQVTTTTDYTKAMLELLRKYPLCIESGDARECVRIDHEHIYYLYRIRSAQAQYGYLPIDREELIEFMEQFHGEIPGCVVDHLDGDRTNNRLRNLMVMTLSEHNKKHGLARRADKLKDDFWCRITRYDDDLVRLHVGAFGTNGKQVEYGDDILTVSECLETIECCLNILEGKE